MAKRKHAEFPLHMTQEDQQTLIDANEMATNIFAAYFHIPYAPVPTLDEAIDMRRRLFSTLKRTGWTPLHSYCIPNLTMYIKDEQFNARAELERAMQREIPNW